MTELLGTLCWGRVCLAPRPQYYASVIRFGSRVPGRKVWPKSKTICLTFSSCRFRLAGGNSLSISGRGTAREKHLKLLAFGLMFIGQVKRPIWINGHLSSQKHRRFQTTCLQANTDYSKYFLFSIVSITC